MKKSKNNKKCKGQAMIETLLTTVLMTIMVFAGIQLVIMVVNDLIMNEAAFAISRVAVVSKKSEVPNKTLIAYSYVLAPHLNLNNVIFAAYDVPIREVEVQGGHGSVKIYDTTVKYVQSVIFGKLLSGPRILSIGSSNVIRNVSRARMVKSSEGDTEFYDKSFPTDAPIF